MKFLKKRSNAVLIAVAVAILATVLGVYGSLTRLSRDIERLFYDGVYLEEEGYTQPSINSQLEIQANAALNLASIMRDYPELDAQTDRLLSTRDDLLNSKFITGKAMHSNNMQSAFYSLLRASKSAELSERELTAAKRYFETFSDSQTFVARNAGPNYNVKVSGLRHETGFPASLISYVIPVTGPEAFFPNSYPKDTYPDPDFVFP